MNRVVQYSDAYVSAKVFDSLDQDGVAAAFSVRRLFESYTGSIMTVRRAHDNAEQDFSFDRTGFLDVAALTQWVTGVDPTGDAFVARWHDQSGGDNHAEMAISSFQPQIVSDGAVALEGDRPTLLFAMGAGAEKILFLWSTFTAINAENQPMATFTVQHRPFGGSDTYNVVFDARNDSGDMFTAPFHEFNTAGMNRRWVNVNRTVNNVTGHLHTEHVFPTNQALMSYVFNGTNGRVYIDGTAIGVETDQSISGAPEFADAAVGGIAHPVGGGFVLDPMFRGGIQEVVIYNADKTPMRTVIEANVNNAYDIF